MPENQTTTTWLDRIRGLLRLDFHEQARREIRREEDEAARLPAFVTLEEHNKLLARVGIPPRERTDP